MVSFGESRAQLEQQGVYIGGWSLRHVLTPSKGVPDGMGTHRCPCFNVLELTFLQAVGMIAMSSSEQPELVTLVGATKRGSMNGTVCWYR